jgi:hypothetical protein
MKRSRGKFGYVLFGALIGIMVSVSILWWTGNNPFKDVHLFKNVKSFFSEMFHQSGDDNVVEAKDTIQNSVKKQGAAIAKNTKTNPDSVYFDTTGIEFYDPDALDEFLAEYGGKLPDSIKIDSVFKKQKTVDVINYNDKGNNGENSQQVKKDKLLYAMSYKVSGLNQLKNATPDMADSLLIDNPGTKNDNSYLRVEFWKSPVNYKGYKTSNYKLILFGINSYDKISFKVFNKTLYMKHRDAYYQLDYSFEFKPFLPITNIQIISQLNK